MGLLTEKSREARKYARRLQDILTEEIKHNRLNYEIYITEEDSINISESIKYLYNAELGSLEDIIKLVGEDVSSRDAVISIHRFFEDELSKVREKSREQKKTQQSKEELEELEANNRVEQIEAFVSQNKYMSIFGELFNILYSDELESRVVAEAIILAKIIATTHDNLVCSTMNIHSAVIAYWAFNVNKKLRLKSNSGVLTFTLKDDKDKLYNIEEISFKDFLKRLFNEDYAVELAIKYLKEFGKEQHIGDRAFVILFDEFIKTVKNQLKHDKSNVMVKHKQSIDEEYEDILKKDYSEYEIKQINKSNRENQIYAAIARSFVFGYNVETHPALKGKVGAMVCTMCRSFIIADYVNWKKNKRVNKLDWLYSEMINANHEERASVTRQYLTYRELD